MTASGPSKVVVLDPDARACRQVQLGFQREGIETVAPAIPTDLATLQLGLTNGDAPGLALVGGTDPNLVRRARELLIAGNADVPIVATGRGGRDELIAAGADAVLAHPVYLRDVVTIARILRNVPTEHRDHLVGSLVETTGVYTLVRALCALGRSAVLTLIRGLRRGEIRFYRGEVTSAQVGLIHGQAAFHQLLLWTDARFDFAYEDIVRRAQIPMSAEELFADAERFLEGVRESADLLSPSMVLEQDTQRVHGLGKQIPTEVHGVLRMFDGHRVLADILEDSPYRLFETLRVAQKAMEAGLLRQVAEQRPKTSWRAVLAIEEWLVGSETRDAVVERTATIDSGSVARQSKPKFKKGKRKAARAAAAAAAAAAPAKEAKPNEIDWGALVPRMIGAEVGPLSGVVPAMDAHGEIDIVTRDKGREKLEALMDTDKRDRIFPTEVGLEPSVVVRNDDDIAIPDPTSGATTLPVVDEARTTAFAKADPEPAIEAVAARAEADGKANADADAKTNAAVKAKADADAKAKADARPTSDADAKAKADADAKAKAGADAKAKADADAKAKAGADAKANADADAKAKADARPTSDADAKAKAGADAKAKADADAKAKGAEAKAKSDADAKAKADADAKAKAGADAKAKAGAEAKAKADADAKAKADADAKAKADADAKAKADADATAKADADARAKADADAKAKTDADARAKADADAKAKADADARAKADADAKAKADADANAKADADAKAKTDADARAKADADAKAKADTDARAKADADSRANADADGKAKADADAKARADADAKAKADTDARAKADADAKAKADADGKAKVDADGKAKADADAKAKADVDAKAKADVDAKAKADADARAKADAAANAKADADARAKADASAANAKAEADAKEEADAKAWEAVVSKAKADADKAEADAARATADVDGARNSAAEEARGYAARVKAAAETKRAEEDRERAAASMILTPVDPDSGSTRVIVADPITVAETSTSTTSVVEKMTVVGKADTATVTATPMITMREDSPSDGTPKAVTTARPMTQRDPRAPEHDGPPVKQTTGEISQPAKRAPEVTRGPSILIDSDDKPDSLVADLAAAHAAIAAATARASTVPSKGDAASSSKEMLVSEVRRDAVEFTHEEEAFFNASHGNTNAVPKFESFDDLDEGYEPPKFWDRVFGRKKKPK